MPYAVQRVTTTIDKDKSKNTKEIWLYWLIIDGQASIIDRYKTFESIPNKAIMIKLPELEVTRTQFNQLF